MSDAAPTQAKTKKDAAGNGSTKVKAEKELRQLQTFATLGADFTGPAPDEALTDGSADGWDSNASSILSHEPSALLRRRISPGQTAKPLTIVPTFGGRNFCNIPTHAGARPAIQPKLTVGAANDPSEQEADRVAEQVMTMPASVSAPPSGDGVPPKPGEHPVQREAEEEEEIQAKPLVPAITPFVRRAVEAEDELQTKRASAADSFDTNADFEGRVNASQGGGAPLPDEVRTFMEPRFGGIDFSGVRVHAGSEAADLNRQVSARAFTLGKDIYLGEGQTNVASDGGKRLLAHELTHVVQQGGAANLGRKANRCASAGCQADEALLKSSVQRQIAEPIAEGKVSPSEAVKINRCASAGCRAEETILKGAPERIYRQIGVTCHPTARWAGNIEHQLIESDYVINVNPGGGAVEYAIPNSGPGGGTGYADMVDLVGHKIYEIKTYLGAPQGVIEAARYATEAQIHCPPPIPQAPWSVGNDYPAHTIPLSPLDELVVQQYPQFSGVVVYYKRQRRRVPVPVPVPVPKPAMDQIRDFLRRVVQSGQNAEEAARAFLREHPELVYVIAGFAIGIFVATIVEDILTLGAGILDDVPTMAAAAALWRVAMQMRAAVP